MKAKYNTELEVPKSKIQFMRYMAKHSWVDHSKNEDTKAMISKIQADMISKYKTG
jgi:hypothetical protein